jgi:hypothetical protein
VLYLFSYRYFSRFVRIESLYRVLRNLLPTVKADLSLVSSHRRTKSLHSKQVIQRNNIAQLARTVHVEVVCGGLGSFKNTRSANGRAFFVDTLSRARRVIDYITRIAYLLHVIVRSTSSTRSHNVGTRTTLYGYEAVRHD